MTADWIYIYIYLLREGKKSSKAKQHHRSHGTMNKLIFVSVVCVCVFLSSLLHRNFHYEILLWRFDFFFTRTGIYALCCGSTSKVCVVHTRTRSLKCIDECGERVSKAIENKPLVSIDRLDTFDTSKARENEKYYPKEFCGSVSKHV